MVGYYSVIVEEPNKEGGMSREVLYLGDERWLAREVYESYIENGQLENNETIYFMECENNLKFENVTNGKEYEEINSKIF